MGVFVQFYLFFFFAMLFSGPFGVGMDLVATMSDFPLYCFNTCFLPQSMCHLC